MTRDQLDLFGDSRPVFTDSRPRAASVIAWNPDWRDKWHYTPNGGRTNIALNHLLRRAWDTPGIDQGVFAYWLDHDIPVLCFMLKHGLALKDGTMAFVCATRTFDVMKVPLNYPDFGLQWMAPMAWYRVKTVTELNDTVKKLQRVAERE